MPKSVIRVTMRCKGATRLLRSLVNCAKSGSYRVGTGKSSDRGAEELLSDDPIFLLPVALQHESGPIIRRLPRVLGAHPLLGAAQGLGRGLVVAQHSLVEFFHQLGRGFVIHLP